MTEKICAYDDCDRVLSHHNRSGYCDVCRNYSRRRRPREIDGTRLVKVTHVCGNSNSVAHSMVRLPAEPWS